MTSIPNKVWKAKEIDAEILKYVGPGYGVFVAGVWRVDVSNLRGAKQAGSLLGGQGELTWLK
jgi:hypothetical protein